MTTEERAKRIAKIVVSGSANAFYVAGTQHQQAAVIANAEQFVLNELREMEMDLKYPDAQRP
jgi:L-asparaginase II